RRNLSGSQIDAADAYSACRRSRKSTREGGLRSAGFRHSGGRSFSDDRVNLVDQLLRVEGLVEIPDGSRGLRRGLVIATLLARQDDHGQARDRLAQLSTKLIAAIAGQVGV